MPVEITPDIHLLTAPLFVVVSGGGSRGAPLSLLVVALPVVVDVTSGRFYLLIFGRQQTHYCACKFVEVIGSGKDGLEMTGLLRIGRPEIFNLGF
jgi:hypothetical protein